MTLFCTEKVPLMILGTSSGAGKSLLTTAICRYLCRIGENPLPFKGQNMSNNAWIDEEGGEMAYSQTVQAWASQLVPSCAMNPILLKPKGDCISEVIHLGRSVGYANAQDYYNEWLDPGWSAIEEGIKRLIASKQSGRLILEGAGSPVEVNLQHKDLTNLRLAKFLNANCILVADIERGGVFAQIIGTLALLKPEEKKLFKGIIINRFRGNLSLFNEGREWIEKQTGIPVLGVMPWIEEIFPPEDSLDLMERRINKPNAEIEVAIIKLPSLSNFSDLDPLNAEPSINLRWIELTDSIGAPDALIIPGSKQTIKDLQKLKETGLANQIKEYEKEGGTIFGICGGLQMMGSTLEDPDMLETTKSYKNNYEGLGIMPIHTIFQKKKYLSQRKLFACWPGKTEIMGFELHHGETNLIGTTQTEFINFSEDSSLGWIKDNDDKGFIGGTYLHGVFDNGVWRRLWINKLRRRKSLKELSIEQSNHNERIERIINRLTDSFTDHINIKKVICS